MLVKNILLLSIFALSLMGCTSITTMSPAQFNQAVSTPLPFSGQWSGAMGITTSTLTLNRQGKGQLCMDNQKELMSYQVKLINNELYTDQGVKFKIKDLNPQTVSLHMSLLGVGSNFNLTQDIQLKNASLRCKQVLNS